MIKGCDEQGIGNIDQFPRTLRVHQDTNIGSLQSLATYSIKPLKILNQQKIDDIDLTRGASSSRVGGRLCRRDQSRRDTLGNAHH